MKNRVLVLCLSLLFALTLNLPAYAQYVKRDVSKLQVGMTTEEVKSLFGRPDHINRYDGPRGEEQQWVYKEGRNQHLYIYFENGLYNGYY
jgi:outer membrane protein assembly factor BamE (lipoprotein component of BamABCDE complex)